MFDNNYHHKKQPENEQMINQQQDQDNQEDEPLPLYAQVEGQKIYMGGLDYSLLQKQKQQDTKKGFLEGLKSKLLNMEKKIDLKNPKLQSKHAQLDQQSKKLITAIKQLKNTKPLINSSTYYLFDTRLHFGKVKPQVITKRMGRMNKQANYIKINPQTITKFKTILERPSKMSTFDMKKQKAVKRLIEQNNDSESQDNIFGSQTQKSDQQTVQKPQLFNFGQKLSFGVSDDDIFKRPTPAPKYQFQIQQKILQTKQPQKDKYDFLRKKVKKTFNQQDQGDDYAQCYIQSGPSFQQMKKYKAQGIQLWGDIKQKQGNKKGNINNVNKDFNKVRRIMEEKYGKKQKK